MDKKMLTTLAGWVLVLAGFAWAFEGLTGTDLVGSVFGGLKSLVDIVVFGGAAAVMTYVMLTGKAKK